jgi:hypothetical protein
MPTTAMFQMWALLQAHTVTPSGEERAVNHLNEWGGYSKKLGMPIFTGWRDHTEFDKQTKTVTALVSDTQWTSAVGVNNQERWLKHAEENNSGIAAFFIIHAVNENATPRKVKYIDDDAVFVGKVVRKGTETFIVGQRRAL